jgi:hypothetical protein
MKAATRKQNQKRRRQLRSRFLAVLQLRRKVLADEEVKQGTKESKSRPAPSDIVPGTKVTYERLANEDRRIAAFHEAGHFVVAKHFKARDVDSTIWEAEEAVTLTDHKFRGHTKILAMPGAVTFRLAVVAWAGCLAETLADRPFEQWQPDDLLWCFEDQDDLGLSDTDKREIDAYQMRWRSFKTAAGILIKRRSELQKVARDLQELGFVAARQGKYITHRAGVNPGSQSPAS